jgi:hypothetical protein
MQALSFTKNREAYFMQLRPNCVPYVPFSLSFHPSVEESLGLGEYNTQQVCDARR